MPLAQDIRGTVFQNGTAVLMARVVGPDGDPIETADVSSIRYSIYEINHLDPGDLSVVAGHEDVALTVGNVIYDTLQTGGLWTVDATGYNFRHEVDVSSDPAFPNAHADYQVRYEVTPTSGQVVVFRFLLHAL